MSASSRLDDVCVIVMGQAPNGAAYNTTGEGWPLIAGAGDFKGSKPNPKKFTTVATQLSRPGDIILGIRASIGEKVHSDGEYCLGRGVAAIRPKEVLDRQYLWHWLSYKSTVLASKGRGATFKQVNRNDIGELPITLPPLNSQRRIAQVLDTAEGLRANRREAIALLDNLTQSVFLDMFGDPSKNPMRWPIKTIGDLVESATYGTSEKAKTEGDIPVLRMNNITTTGEIDLRNLKYMDRSAVDDRHLVRQSDILFNRTNSVDLVGKTGIYRDTEPLAYAGYLVRIRANSNNNAEYIAAFLNTSYAKLVLRNMCKSIVGMANINAREMQSIKIISPPAELQEEFATRIRTIESIKAVHKAHLAELDALFASLQHRAFRGELGTEAAA